MTTVGVFRSFASAVKAWLNLSAWEDYIVGTLPEMDTKELTELLRDPEEALQAAIGA